MVDIKNGHRASSVETREVARFIVALSEFIEALVGVEATKSSVLLAKNIRGTRPLDALTAGKKDVKRLCIALANFLSKKMKTERNLILSNYSLDQKKPAGDKVIFVNTQADAIRALLKAHDVSGIEAYLWSAQEIYFAMNKNLYSVKKEFYVNSDGSELSFPEKLNTLRALSEIKVHVPTESQKQLQRIIDPWLDALGALK